MKIEVTVSKSVADRKEALEFLEDLAGIEGLREEAIWLNGAWVDSELDGWNA